MKKILSVILLVMLSSVFLTACANKIAKESEIEITEMEEQTETQEEDVNTDLGFKGGVLEESDADVESDEKNPDSSREIIEENIDESGDESESLNSEDADLTKENSYKEDLLGLPAESPAGVI